MNFISKIGSRTNVRIIEQNIRCYAAPGGLMKKAVKKGTDKAKKIVLEVETDPKTLLKYVCGSNIYKTGEDVKLKEDSEYPSWLWDLVEKPSPKLEDLDPNEITYWRKLRKEHMKETLKKLKHRR